MSKRIVFGVDRIPDPWQPTYEDGELVSSEDLAAIERQRARASRAFREASLAGEDEAIEVRGASGQVVAVLDADGWRIMPTIRRGDLAGADEEPEF